jgi:hypothetical protein
VPKPHSCSLKIMFDGGVGRAKGGFAGDEAEGVVGAGESEVVFQGEGFGGFGDVAGHGGGAVGFVVDEAGDGGDEAFGDKFADEAYAAAALVADVEAEVDFGEVSVAGPFDAEDGGVEEIEGDEADEGATVKRSRPQPGGVNGARREGLMS